MSQKNVKNIIIAAVIIAILALGIVLTFNGPNIIKLPLASAIATIFLIGGLFLIKKGLLGYGLYSYSFGMKLIKPNKATSYDRIILWFQSIFYIFLGTYFFSKLFNLL